MKRLFLLFTFISLFVGNAFANGYTPGSILITEIMASPEGSTDFPATKYIEIFNASDSTIDLKDWLLISDDGSFALPEIALNTGEYAVLYESGLTIHIDAGGVPAPLSSFPTNLTSLKIEDPDSIEIDAVTCPAPTPARSFERDMDGNLYLSNDPRGGTPGSINSPKTPPPPTDDYTFGDIWINEIMVNPVSSPELGNAEFIELYNNTSSAINLKNWTFIYNISATSKTVVTLPEISLPAGGYAVLYRSTKSLTVDPGGIAIPVANFPSTLANTGRLLELKSPKDVLIDAVTYPNSSSFAGTSWERESDGTYHLSNDPRGGTPGAINSPDQTQFGDVWINEIMVNPTGAAALPETEYIELYNATATDISLRGWSFIYNATATSRTIVSLPGVMLPAGGYAVLYRTGKVIDTDAASIAIPVSNFPSTLAKDGRLLELKNSKDVLIDAVTYPNSTNYAGSSWERDMTGNYYPSNDPRGGTPGMVNSSDNSRPGDIVINEIMVNPDSSLVFGDAEYIELYNVTTVDINLRGWSFIYHASATSSTVVIFPGVILPAGGYAVLYRTGNNLVVDAGGIAIPVANFPSTLAKDGRSLELKNSTGTLIDAVTYPNSTALPGSSWERDKNGNYYPSSDLRGGTPGSINSSDNTRLGNIVINEIMANPTGATALPETEYVELYNPTRDAINLNGWTLVYDTRTVVYLPGVVLPAGGYAVLYRDGRNITIDTGGMAVPLASFPATLANDGRLLELKNSTNVLIDSVTYKDTSTIPGCSWERDTAGNYYPSNDPRGGTPGSKNSFDNSKFGDVWINEIMANPKGSTSLPETEYIELLNRTVSAINLRGWKLIYDARTVVTLPGVMLPAGGYAVLYREGRDIYVESGGIAIPVANFPSAMADDGRYLELSNSRGILIDSVTYKNADNLKGIAWERDASGDFYPSNDPRGGTPGMVNSQDNSRFGDVWINEIMSNPVGAASLPETEYIELYNASDVDINLGGWTLVYDSKTIVFLPGVTLPVGGYAVLYREGHDIVIDKGGIAIPLSNFPASLANDGRLLELKNSRDVLIDAATYGNSTNTGGRSWERDKAGNFALSNDPRGGTPGAANALTEQPVTPDNSQFGDVWLNEVMADPSGLSALPATEYIELYNRSANQIFLHGWTLIYDASANIALPDVMLPANGYAVLYRAGREIYVDGGGLAMPISNFPSALANTGKKLELTNSLHLLIDSITYPSAKPARSWERDAEKNLYLSTDPRGGTPGAVNSPKEPQKPPVEPDNAKFGDVRINEIMANPTGSTSFPETEYVELYNASDTAIQLNGWSFVYGTRTIPLPAAILPADGYAVLFRAGSEIFVDDGGIAIPIATFPAALANTGGYLAITSPKNNLIDSISYPAAQAAWAWERDSDGSLYLSYNPRGGTPGSVNSTKSNPENPSETSLFVSEKEWIINELLPEEFVGGNEYIELYNRSNRPLFIGGLSVATRRSDGTLSTHYSLSSIKEVFPPGAYIVLTTNRNGVLDFYYTPSPQLIYEVRLPALNNSESTIVLFRTTDEIVIDELSYSSKWHDQGIKNLKGVALERINPDVDTQLQSNWTSAIASVGYGTPAYQNSQYRSNNAQGNIHVDIPAYQNGFGYYLIPYQLDKNGYRSRMEVYTVEGRKVAEITNNQLLGFEGEIKWDGLGMDGSRLPAGLYIFYAELFHPDGSRKSFKNVFLVKP